MDVEAYNGENDFSQSQSTVFSEEMQEQLSSHTAIIDNGNIILQDPKTDQYLQVLNGADSKNYAHHGGDNDCIQCKEGLGNVYHIDVQSLLQLKDSTKKLICLLEEIESKTHTKVKLRQDTQKIAELLKPFSELNTPQTVTDEISEENIKKLENHAKAFDATLIQDPEDDCSIYKRLTRKCVCLNQPEYNDFVIHFNENSKFLTSCIGEIIKNLRILKKFLYMGSDYTKHALMFLNEAFSESTFTEKLDICLGCSHADMCNIFDDHSMVVLLISWPCKYNHYGDSISQGLAAAFLYKLAQLEEGRTYLKFSSKITNDIKKVLRTKVNKIEVDTLKSLNATLNLLHPALAQQSHHVNMTYYCKPVDEGFGSNTLGALVQYRQYMTLDEVMIHLDLLQNLSEKYTGREELIAFLPALLALFKRMLVEYDNSEMNIIITTILNNVVSPSMLKSERPRSPKIKKVVANTATEPIIMINDSVQIPPRKPKKVIKSKLGLAGIPKKVRQKSFRNVKEWNPSQNTNKSSTRIFNNSRKFGQDSRNPFIIVPIGRTVRLE